VRRRLVVRRPTADPEPEPLDSDAELLRIPEGGLASVLLAARGKAPERKDVATNISPVGENFSSFDDDDVDAGHGGGDDDDAFAIARLRLRAVLGAEAAGIIEQTCGEDLWASMCSGPAVGEGVACQTSPSALTREVASQCAPPADIFMQEGQAMYLSEAPFGSSSEGDSFSLGMVPEGRVNFTESCSSDEHGRPALPGRSLMDRLSQRKLSRQTVPIPSYTSGGESVEDILSKHGVPVDFDLSEQGDEEEEAYRHSATGAMSIAAALAARTSVRADTGTITAKRDIPKQKVRAAMLLAGPIQRPTRTTTMPDGRHRCCVAAQPDAEHRCRAGAQPDDTRTAAESGPAADDDHPVVERRFTRIGPRSPG